MGPTVSEKNQKPNFSFFPHLSLLQLGNLTPFCSFNSVLFCSVQLDIFMNSLNCQEKDSPLTTVRLLSGIQYFVALCASIFVEIQKVWVRIDGLF